MDVMGNKKQGGFIVMVLVFLDLDEKRISEHAKFN
jgi:hypothetical protein